MVIALNSGSSGPGSSPGGARYVVSLGKTDFTRTMLLFTRLVGYSKLVGVTLLAYYIQCLYCFFIDLYSRSCGHLWV